MTFAILNPTLALTNEEQKLKANLGWQDPLIEKDYKEPPLIWQKVAVYRDRT
jgi:hypothetical protein